jgi:maltooligosyltrehalose trehalohydrolase
LVRARRFCSRGRSSRASAPFHYFADFDEPLIAAVREGRRTFLSQFTSVSNVADRGYLTDPGSPRHDRAVRLDWREREGHAAAFAFHRDLLHLRRLLLDLRREEDGIDGAVLSASAFALRFFTEGHAADRVLVRESCGDLHRSSIAEPLLAPPAGGAWTLAWCSEDPAYGGSGVTNVRPRAATAVSCRKRGPAGVA